MIELSDVALKLITTAAGVSIGGGILIWFAKLMAARLIKQYDEKHIEHDRRFRELSTQFAEQLTDLKVKLAKLEPLVISAIALKGDLKAAENHIAVIKHVVQKTNTDVNAAHKEIRVLTKEIESLKQ